MRCHAGFDVGDSGLSSEALSAVGISPGSTVTVNGTSYTRPDVVADEKDNVQVIRSPGRREDARRARNGDLGPIERDREDHYEGGSTQQVTLSFSDWTLDGNRASNETVAATVSYRCSSGGLQNSPTYLCSDTFPLDSGSTVKSIALPNGCSGQLHVFAISVDG